MVKKIKMIALALCSVMTVSLFAGCGPTSKTGESENIEIKIGYWPNKDTDPQKYEIYMGYVEKYAKIGAGSTITKLVPEQSLAIARSRQVVLEKKGIQHD
mgnify:CR=1 FL=1